VYCAVVSNYIVHVCSAVSRFIRTESVLEDM
jgi:hypothetical protein